MECVDNNNTSVLAKWNHSFAYSLSLSIAYTWNMTQRFGIRWISSSFILTITFFCCCCFSGCCFHLPLCWVALPLWYFLLVLRRKDKVKCRNVQSGREIHIFVVVIWLNLSYIQINRSIESLRHEIRIHEQHFGLPLFSISHFFFFSSCFFVAFITDILHFFFPSGLRTHIFHSLGTFQSIILENLPQQWFQRSMCNIFYYHWTGTNEWLMIRIE